MAAVATTSVPKAGKSPFAGLAKNKATNTAEDDKDKTKSEDDKDKTKSEDDKDKTKSEDDKDKTKPEDDKDKTKSEDDKDKTKSEDDKDKTKSEDDEAAKAEDGDDESDEEDKASAKIRQARARERGRIAAIMTSDAGLANPEAAARLAIRTELPRSEAIAMLEAVGPSTSTSEAPRKDALRDRMKDEKKPDIGTGSDAHATGGDLVQQIVAADKWRRGEK